MPGSYMGDEITGINPGKGFLRISIVDEINIIEDVMKRLCLFLQSYNNKQAIFEMIHSDNENKKSDFLINFLNKIISIFLIFISTLILLTD